MTEKLAEAVRLLEEVRNEWPATKYGGGHLSHLIDQAKLVLDLSDDTEADLADKRLRGEIA